jgi:hypothetical protein
MGPGSRVFEEPRSHSLVEKLSWPRFDMCKPWRLNLNIVPRYFIFRELMLSFSIYYLNGGTLGPLVRNNIVKLSGNRK